MIPAAVRTGTAPDPTAVASVLLCVVDIAGMAAVLSGVAGTALVLTLHVAAVVVLGGVPLWRRRRSVKLEQWCVIALLFGPFGGIALCLFQIASAWRGGTSAPAKQRPDLDLDVSPAGLLATRIRDGRRHRMHMGLPASFADVFASDDLPAQQRAIASISRSYRPEMRDGLRLALESDVPAIRVQAAAVHARLRGEFDARAKALLARGRPFDPQEAQQVARSGFVAPDVGAMLTRADPDITPATRSAPKPSVIVAFRKSGQFPALVSQRDLDEVTV